MSLSIILATLSSAATIVARCDAADPLLQPGVEGGIPHRAVVHSVTDFGAVGNGTTDDSGAFQNALDALPEGGGAVWVPPGTYLLRSPIYMWDRTVLRGSGAASTHLEIDFGGGPGHAIEIVIYDYGDWVGAVSGFDRGSTEITVTDASEFTVPGYAEIEQENDPGIMYTDPEWDQVWAQQAVGELCRVIGRNGNRLSLAEPLGFSYDPGLTPRVRPTGLLEYAGIEDLHIKLLDNSPSGLILFKNAAFAWVRGVESEKGTSYHVGTERAYRCEVRQSYFHQTDQSGGGLGYGLSLERHTTGCLVEDNIFRGLRYAIKVSIGSNSNVLGYNFSTETLPQPFYRISDMSLHGHYPFENVFEGNVVDQIAISDYWGPSGPGNTLLRNCIKIGGIWVYDFAHGQKLIGNVLPTGPENNINIDPTVLNTTIHGNFVNGSLQWDPANTDHTIPPTRYHGATPWFFDGFPWPSIGGDLGTACTNPAARRWANGESIPQKTAGVVFTNGFESGNSAAWSNGSQPP